MLSTRPDKFSSLLLLPSDGLQPQRPDKSVPDGNLDLSWAGQDCCFTVSTTITTPVTLECLNLASLDEGWRRTLQADADPHGKEGASQGGFCCEERSFSQSVCNGSLSWNPRAGRPMGFAYHFAELLSPGPMRGPVSKIRRMVS